MIRPSTGTPGYARRSRGRAARRAVRSARIAAAQAAFLSRQASYPPPWTPSGPSMPGWLATTIGVLVALAIAQVFRG
jgi:hypothetical protein